MKKIIKKSTAPIISGSVTDTDNVTDKITNAPSVRLVENLLANAISLPIGAGCDYFGTSAPKNFMFADGSAISRTTYSELFAIIGTTYGAGDGSTTFNLPDKRTRVSVMKNASGTFATLGAKGGAETHTLVVSEMPSHTHTQNAHSHSIGRGNDANVGTGTSHYGWFPTDDKTGSYAIGSTTATNQNTGGGQAHNNLQPYLVCNYIIKVKNDEISAEGLVNNVLEGEY